MMFTDIFLLLYISRNLSTSLQHICTAHNGPVLYLDSPHTGSANQTESGSANHKEAGYLGIRRASVRLELSSTGIYVFVYCMFLMFRNIYCKLH